MAMQRTAAALLPLVLIGLASSALADPPRRTDCFFVHEMRGWKAPDARTIYIRVDPHRYFRLDMAVSCPALLHSGARMISRRHSDVVCDASDWQIRVSQGPWGPAMACLVGRMTELTPAEADAIPDRFRPH